MKKITTSVAMAQPYPYQTKKRPMSRGNNATSQARSKTYFTTFISVFILCSCAISSAFGQAQNQSEKQNTNQNTTQSYLLKGTITDTQTNPLAGAAVIETGTTNSAQSQTDGSFQLKTAKPSGKLTISYLGFLAKQETFDTSKPLDIQLTEDPATLKAVEINTGYYSVSQKKLTGNITSIKAAEIEKQPVTSLLQALQGRVAGAYISQPTGTPGAGMNIVIRGQNGIETSTNALYIIDGVPYSSSSLFNTLTGTTGIFSSSGSSPLNAIPPEEIASIEILKDADATAIYGSRGANGVILITTKKARTGKTSVELSAQSGISAVAHFVPLLNTEDYLALRRTAIALDGAAIKATDYDLNGSWDQSAQTNWQKELFGNTAKFNTIRAAISGGTQQNSFLLSGTYQSQGTVYTGNQNYGRASVHLASSHSTLDNKLKASFSAIYSTDHTNWLNSDYVSRSMSLSPNAPQLKNPDGSLNWANSTWINPIRNDQNKYTASNNGLTANANISYAPVKDLVISTSLGWQQQNLDDSSLLPVSYYDPSENRTSATSISDFNQSSLSGWTIEPKASYNKSTKFGSFSFLLGASLQDQKRNQQIQRGTGFASDALIENIAAATTIQIRGNTLSQYRYSGTYARFNYTLKDRYILNLTARRDYSSRFGTGRRSANFGAIGLAYLFSEERLVRENLPFLSFGKFRASYGTTGNDQIGDYEYLDTYRSLSGYNGLPALSPVRLFNADFGWEENKKLEVGLDLGFLKDRITATISHFRNRSSSQLIDYPLAYSTGFGSIRANLGAVVQNTGWELELGSRNIQRKNFSWASSFNLTLPKNKLVSFPNLEASSYASTYVIGQPLNIQKLLELKGVNPTTGLYEYTDFNGDKAINAADRQVIRRRGQTAYGGLENNLKYKNFEMSFLFQFVIQRASTFRAQHNLMPGRIGNQPQAYQGTYWLKAGDIAEMQRPSAGGVTAANTALTNYYISDAVNADASFARLKNLQVAYRTDRLIKGMPIRISLQGQNLWTITNYFGIDPENTALLLPPLRTITLGLNLSL